MPLDVAHDRTPLAPVVRVTWIGPQRPVEGTVFVKPPVEDDAEEKEARANATS
jgi:hypothetical protein